MSCKAAWTSLSCALKVYTMNTLQTRSAVANFDTDCWTNDLNSKDCLSTINTFYGLYLAFSGFLEFQLIDEIRFAVFLAPNNARDHDHSALGRDDALLRLTLSISNRSHFETNLLDTNRILSWGVWIPSWSFSFSNMCCVYWLYPWHGRFDFTLLCILSCLPYH